MDRTAVEDTSESCAPSYVQDIWHGFLTTKLQVIERERNDCSEDGARATPKRRRRTISNRMRPEFDEFQRSEYGTEHLESFRTGNVPNDSRCSAELSHWNHPEHSSSRDDSRIRYSKDGCEEPWICRRLRKLSQPSEYPDETSARTYFRRNAQTQIFGESGSATDTNEHRSLDTRHPQRSETAHDNLESQTDGGKSRVKHGKKKHSKKHHKPKRKKESAPVDCSSLDGLRGRSKAECFFDGEDCVSTIRHKTSTKQKMKPADAELEIHQETEGYENTWLGRYNSTKMFRKRRLESSSNEGTSRTSLHSRESPGAIPSTMEHIRHGLRRWKNSEKYENRSDKECSYRSELDATSHFPHEAEKLSSGCDKKKRRDKSSSDHHRHKRKKRHKEDDVTRDSEKQLVKENLSLETSRADQPPKAKRRKRSRKTERKHKKKNHSKTESTGEITKELDDVIDEDSFRPMQVHAEPSDDVTELLFKNRNTSNKSSDGQLDYDAVIACAETSSLPPRLVKTYRDGVAVSRLLKRVKTRLGPVKPAVVQRNLATLPRHPVLVLKGKHDKNDPVGDGMSLKSTVVQDVEDPGSMGKIASGKSEDEIGTASKEDVESNICDELSLTGAVMSEDNCDEIRATALRNVCSDSDIFTPEDQNDDALRSELQVNDLRNVRSDSDSFTPEKQNNDALSSELQVDVNMAVHTTDNLDKGLINTDTISTEAEGELIDGDTNEIKSQAFDVELSTDQPDKALPLESVNDDSTEHCCSIENMDIEAVAKAGEVECSLEGIPVVEETASDNKIGDELEDKVTGQDSEELDAVVDKSDIKDETISAFDINDTVENATSIHDKNTTSVHDKNATSIHDKNTTSEHDKNATSIHDKNTTSEHDNCQPLTENPENKRQKLEKLYLSSYVREGCSNADYPRMSSDNIGRMIEQIRNAESADRSECRLEMIARDPHGDHSDCEMEMERHASEKSNDRRDLDPAQHSGDEGTCLPGGENVPKSELWSMKKAAKKLAKHMGIKISDWSTAFILSGERYENDPKKRNREEGELTDSSADSSSESEKLAPIHENSVSELLSSGSLSDSIEDTGEASTKSKSPKKQKKHKRKHKKHKRHGKHRRSKGSSDEEEEVRRICRSRSRAFSVTRSFDEKKGVWRDRKKKLKLSDIWGRKRKKLDIDKEKLREIAVKNSLHNIRQIMKVTNPARPRATDGARIGGKSVAELTDFCKTISGGVSYSSSDGEGENDRLMENDEADIFVHNFLRSRDKDARIVLNIRDSKPLPALTAQQMIAKRAVMRLMYPVSNGAQHRYQGDWVPVAKPDPPSSTVSEPVPTVTIPVVPPTSAAAAAVELASARAPACDDGLGAENPLTALQPTVDVGVILAERLAAIKRLSENPFDQEALQSVQIAQMKMQLWAEKKQIPGQFFSSVARPFACNKLKKHDWLRKASGNETNPCGQQTAVQNYDIAPADGATATGRTYNIGKLMMLRMGWKEGEGLGRQNLGRPTPISLDMKKDRKGLQAPEESPRPVLRTCSVAGKHPVSALMELCTRRHLGSPNFVLVGENGPSHYKQFLYKVIVNGVEYQPSCGSRNKKTARLEAARCCLGAMGIA